jgi:hypothetical protein
MLKANKHPSSHLQASFNKYGIQSFEWSVVKLCPIDELNTEEINVIAAIGRENLFNFTDGGEGMKGFKHTEECKKRDSLLKLADWAAGKWVTPDMAIKRINVFTGQEHTYDRAGNAESDGFYKNSIMSCLCGIKKTHKGFFWVKSSVTIDHASLVADLGHLSLQQAKAYYSFAMLLDGNTLDDDTKPVDTFIPKRVGGAKKKPIERIDVVTGLIKEYESVASAARDWFDRSTVQRTLKGEYSTYRGYYWSWL